MGKEYRILFLEIDDEEAERIRLELEKLELSLQIVRSSGSEALSGRLEKVKPDLVIAGGTYADPGEEGFLRQFQGDFSRLPVICIMDRIGTDAAEAMCQGAADCVEKENLTRLAPAVRRELLRRRNQRRAERQRDKAYDIADIGHWELDLVNDRLFWSDMIRKLHEVGPEYEPELESALEFYKEGTNRETVRRAVEQAIENGTPFDVEAKLVTARGNERWVRTVGDTVIRDGKCVRIYGSTQDITERKLVEEKMRDMVEHSTNMFYRHDPDHRLTYVSPQSEEFLGYPPEEAKRRWTEFVTGHPINEKGFAHTQRAIDTGEPQPPFELQLEKADGEVIWVQVNEAPIVENGETVAIVGSLTDITERKEIEVRQRLQQNVSRYFKAAENLNDILDRVLRYLAGYGRFSRAELWLVDTRDSYIQLGSSVSRGDKGEIFLHASRSVNRFEKGEGLPGMVWKSNASRYWENISSRSDFVRRSAAAEAGLESALGVPVRHNDKPLGVLLLAGARERFARDVRKYEALQDVLGAEIRRKQQEEEMQLLFESAPDIIAIVAPDKHFVRVNPAFCEMLGYSEEEITSRPYEEFVHPEDLEKSREEFKETITGERKARNFVNRWRTRSGEYRWISWSSSEVYNREGFVFSFGRDITALREAEQRAAQTLERIGDAFFAVDEEWNVTYWNREAERVLQKPKEEILGKHLWTEYEDAVDLDFYTEYHRAVREQVTVHFEEFYPALEKWFEVSAYPSSTGLSVYFRDVTERKRNEERIKRVNERFEKVTEATNDAIWDYDVEQGELFWGRGFETLFGYDLEQTDPSLEFLLELIHPEDRERITRRIEQYMQSDKGTEWYEEYRFRRVDRSYAYVMDRATFIRDEEGSVIRVVGAMTDLSTQKRQEESLKDLNRELEEHAEKLARSNDEKETLLMEIHHRVKNNLAVVSGMMQLQAFGEEDSALGEKLLDSVSRIQAMASIHDLLYRSKSYSRLNLAENIRKLVSNIVGSFHRDAEIDVLYDLEPVVMNINQAIPCSLMVNEVVTNVIKHAFDGGQEGRMEIALLERGQRISLRIEDSGKGLPDDFDSSAQAESLGMRLIQTLAQQLEAEYHYESLDPGTRFRVVFEKADVRGIGSSHLI
ncbi:MAG: PAS domain S-box protein [Balneolaceae bacterium]|nr:PAS domain S-box protein [Balneolaceae bacterium]